MAHGNTDEPTLSDLMDIGVLDEILEVFAAVTRTTVCICERSGRILSRSSKASPVCRLMSESELSRHACRQCVNEAIEQAVAGAEPVSLRCHADMDEYAAPVLMDGRLLAVIVMSDLLHQHPDRVALDDMADRYRIDRGVIEAAFSQAETSSEDQISAAVGFLRLLADTLARFCKQESQLRHRMEELTTVYDTTAMFAGTRDLDEVLSIAARNVTSVLRVKACGIRLLDRETGELEVAAVENLSPEYLNKGPVKIEENPIDKAAIDGETVMISDIEHDDRTRYPDHAKKEGLVSGMVAGMVFRGKPVGVIRIYTDEPHEFSAFEAALLRAVAAQAAAAIENTRLTQEATRSEIVNRQVRTAAQVQRRMVPANAPKHRHLEFGGVYEPTYDLAGDFYDFLELDGGLIGLAIADVVGKGVPAALMMASVRSSLRVWANGLEPIDEIVGKVNSQVCRDTLPQEFTTLFYGVFSGDGRRLTYCNAGHDPPLLVRDGRIQRLEVGGMLIGIEPDAVYESDAIDLVPDDVIVFYTDGAVDAMNFAEQNFGRRRLDESLIRYAGLPGSAIAKNVLWDVRRFIGLADQIDDITMVSVKVTR